MISSIIFISFLCIRAFLATILIMAGSSKLTDRTGFVTSLVALGIPAYRKTFAYNLALIISLVEILVGLLVIIGLWLTMSDLLLLATMIVFTFVVAFGLHKAPHTDCRCFGALGKSRFDKRSLIRNVLFTIAALFIFLLRDYFPLQQAQTPVIVYLLLLIGYLLLALSTAQTAKIAVLVKGRMS